jgi:hypothetical protein
MILSYPNTLSAPICDTVHDDETANLIDRLRILEAENRDLQQLVCYLLQKNETLRMQIWRSCNEN